MNKRDKGVRTKSRTASPTPENVGIQTLEAKLDAIRRCFELGEPVQSVSTDKYQELRVKIAELFHKNLF